jgi:hypothetical protein
MRNNAVEEKIMPTIFPNGRCFLKTQMVQKQALTLQMNLNEIFVIYKKYNLNALLSCNLACV